MGGWRGRGARYSQTPVRACAHARRARVCVRARGCMRVRVRVVSACVYINTCQITIAPKTATREGRGAKCEKHNDRCGADKLPMRVHTHTLSLNWASGGGGSCTPLVPVHGELRSGKALSTPSALSGCPPRALGSLVTRTHPHVMCVRLRLHVCMCREQPFPRAIYHLPNHHLLPPCPPLPPALPVQSESLPVSPSRTLSPFLTRSPGRAKGEGGVEHTHYLPVFLQAPQKSHPPGHSLSICPSRLPGSLTLVLSLRAPLPHSVSPSRRLFPDLSPGLSPSLPFSPLHRLLSPPVNLSLPRSVSSLPASFSPDLPLPSIYGTTPQGALSPTPAVCLSLPRAASRSNSRSLPVPPSRGAQTS